MTLIHDFVEWYILLSLKKSAASWRLNTGSLFMITSFVRQLLLRLRGRDPRFIGVTGLDGSAEIQSLIAIYSDLTKAFGSDWLTSISAPGQDIRTCHPLFWELAN